MSDISYDKIESNKILGLFRVILDYTRLTTKYFCVSPYINKIEFYVDSFNKPFTIEDVINSSVERFSKLYIEPYINTKGNNICY